MTYSFARSKAEFKIEAARHAAPKPLSILTTPTPGAHPLNIPSNAASPPKLAPYPTEVGTATIGAATSPATALGKSAFHPRDHNQNSCLTQRLQMGQQSVNARHTHIMNLRSPLNSHHPPNNCHHQPPKNRSTSFGSARRQPLAAAKCNIASLVARVWRYR